MSDNKVLKVLNYIWVPTIVALVIFYLCCIIKPSNIPETPWYFPIEKDKVVHFLMYFGLAGVASFNYIYVNKGEIIILKMVVFAVLLPIFYGGLIELLQAHYFERTGDWFDFLANALGAISTIPFSLKFRSYFLKQKHIEQII